MSNLEFLQDESLDLHREVTESLLDEVQVLHHFAHDNIEGLQIVLSSWARECHHELIGKFIKEVVRVAKEFDEIGVLVERVWQVL